MPPKAKITKALILETAMDMVRQGGIECLNARAVAAQLGCSTQPIFSQYDSMESLKADVLAGANALYLQYLKEGAESGRYPPYKASGMAYIRFAGEEKELFKLLFMRDRTAENIAPTAEWEEICAEIQKSTGLSREMAELFHMEMWSIVHGIAAMSATSYLQLDTETESMMLTDVFEGLKVRFAGRSKA